MALVHVPPFESFYVEHRDAVLRELRRMLGRERAEDAYQETFLRALRGVRTAPQRRQPARLGADDRAPRRRRPATAGVRPHRRRRSPPPTRAPPTPSSVSSRTTCRARNARPSCCATATTFPTPPSAPRSARARTPPARRLRLEFAAYEGGCNDRLPHSRQPVPRGRGRRRACSTSRTTSPTRRSGRCSSRRPTAASAGSRSTRSRSARPNGSPKRSASGSCAQQSRSTTARRQLDEYFEGKRTRFELPVDLRQSAPFSREILKRLARVPHGETTTYGALAARRRPPPGRARRRHRHEPEPDPDRPPLPPGRRRERLAHRLRRRPRAQGAAAQARGSARQLILDM